MRPAPGHFVIGGMTALLIAVAVHAHGRANEGSAEVDAGASDTGWQYPEDQLEPDRMTTVDVIDSRGRIVAVVPAEEFPDGPAREIDPARLPGMRRAWDHWDKKLKDAGIAEGLGFPRP